MKSLLLSGLFLMGTFAAASTQDHLTERTVTGNAARSLYTALAQSGPYTFNRSLKRELKFAYVNCNVFGAHNSPDQVNRGFCDGLASASSNDAIAVARALIEAGVADEIDPVKIPKSDDASMMPHEVRDLSCRADGSGNYSCTLVSEFRH